MHTFILIIFSILWKVILHASCVLFLALAYKHFNQKGRNDFAYGAEVIFLITILTRNFIIYHRLQLIFWRAITDIYRYLNLLISILLVFLFFYNILFTYQSTTRKHIFFKYFKKTFKEKWLHIKDLISWKYYIPLLARAPWTRNEKTGKIMSSMFVKQEKDLYS